MRSRTPATAMSRRFFSFTILCVYGPCLYRPVFISAVRRSRLYSRSASNSRIDRLGFLPARKARHECQIFVKLRSMEELSVISTTYEVYKKFIDLNTKIDKKYRHTLAEP